MDASPVDGVRPRSLILTLLGAYVRRLDGWIPIAGLIELMGELGVDEQSVRAAISRLKRRGIAVAERRDGVAGYGMSESGMQIFEEGDVRIYGRPRAAPLADGWILAVFSVPDSKRADRHVLRSTLSWLGFGNLSSAVWIAPWHVHDETERALRRAGLDGYVHLFHSHYAAFGDVRDLVSQSWDLPLLQTKYDEFERATAPLVARWNGRRAHGRDAFVDHVTILNVWRMLPFLDAGLPLEALPEGWPGPRAWTTFHDLIGRLEAPATAYVQAMMEQFAASDGRAARRNARRV